MQKLSVLSYEVYVLSKDGWTLHARFPGEEQKEALTEAKAAEARLAAATKVIRSEYSPRTNEEVRKEIYSSRMTAAEATAKLPARPQDAKPLTAEARPAKAPAGPIRAPAGQTPQPSPPRPAPRRARPGRQEERAYSPGAVIGQIVLIIGAAGLMAGLITMTAGAIFGETLPFIGTIGFERRRSLLLGLFVATFLLMAVPWMVALARRVGDIDFGLGHHSNRREQPAKPKAPPRQAPQYVPEPAAPPPPEAIEAEPEAPNEEDVEPEEVEPVGEEALDSSGDDAGADDADDEGELETRPESAKRNETMRRSLIRFLSGLVNGLQEARPHLDGYERFGLGLLIKGAAEALAERTGVGPKGFEKLLREALSVLGTRASVEVLVEEIGSAAEEPRARRMIEAGRVAVLQFLRGSRDYMVAVLAALEQWNRPAGATGTGVVAALVAEAWPFDDSTADAARDIAHAQGGAVLGIADGLVMMFPGAARAVDAALELLPRLPTASRIGIDAIEASGEDEALQSVATARIACENAAPGQILVTGVVRGLCSRLPATFAEAPAANDGTPLFAVTVGAAASTAEAGTETVATD